MTGRERFEHATRGAALAFVPHVWERLDEFVREPHEGWRRDANTVRRMLADAAGLAGADGMVVGAALDAAYAVAAREQGVDALDGLCDAEETRAAFEITEVLVQSAPFATLGLVPGLRLLTEILGGDEAEAEEAAEDALSDLVRGFCEAGADGLMVVDRSREAVERSAGRLRTAAEYYARPLLAESEGDAWAVTGVSGDVALVGSDGTWPELSTGIVLTDGDVSVGWDAERLAAVGRGRP